VVGLHRSEYSALCSSEMDAEPVASGLEAEAVPDRVNAVSCAEHAGSRATETESRSTLTQRIVVSPCSARGTEWNLKRKICCVNGPENHVLKFHPGPMGIEAKDLSEQARAITSPIPGRRQWMQLSSRNQRGRRMHS